MAKTKKIKEIPKFSHPLIETHCHLDYLKEDILDNILEKSKKYGVEKIITISVSPDNLSGVIALADKYQNIFCSQGIHPHEASKWTTEIENIIEENLKKNKVLAVGEIGLDYHYEHSPRKVQQEVFEKQLQMAVSHDLPVIIHTRDADEDTKSILKNFANSLKRKGVVHSFTSGLELAKVSLSQGFMLGFNGIITFKSAENVREVLSHTPLEQLLLETDAPFLTPTPFRGQENAPFYLPLIAAKIAEVKETSIENVLEQAYKNSCNLFSF